MGAAQRRTTEIARGLFAVRYVGADDSGQPPLVRITVEACLLKTSCCKPVVIFSGRHCYQRLIPRASQ